MLLPIGDRPNPKNFTPWVNYSLMSINILIYIGITLPLSFSSADPGDANTAAWLEMARQQVDNPAVLSAILAEQSAYDMFAFVHGYKSGAIEIRDLFSSMFLHGGFMHLAGNMLFLWIYGDNVEYRLGRAGYLGVYLLAGIAAAVFYGVLNPGSMIPMIGASGAISGVLGLYFFLFPANEVQILFVWFPFLIRKFYIGARWVLGFFVVVDNLLPMAIGTSTGVAYGAHIGGFIFGLIAAFAASVFVARPKARGDQSKGAFHLKMARHRMSQGQDVSAYQHLQKAMKIDPSLTDEARTLMAEIAT